MHTTPATPRERRKRKHLVRSAASSPPAAKRQKRMSRAEEAALVAQNAALAARVAQLEALVNDTGAARIYRATRMGAWFRGRCALAAWYEPSNQKAAGNGNSYVLTDPALVHAVLPNALFDIEVADVAQFQKLGGLDRLARVRVDTLYTDDRFGSLRIAAPSMDTVVICDPKAHMLLPFSTAPGLSTLTIRGATASNLHPLSGGFGAVVNLRLSSGFVDKRPRVALKAALLALPSHLPGLESLSLDYMAVNVTDRAVAAFAGLASLTTLRIRGATLVGGAACRALGAAEALETLELTDCPLVTGGAGAALGGSRSIHRLVLTNCRLDGAGLLALLAMPALRCLEGSSPLFTEADRAAVYRVAAERNIDMYVH